MSHITTNLPYVTPRPRRATWASKPAQSDDARIEIVRNNAVLKPPVLFNNNAIRSPPSPGLSDDKLESAMKDLDNLQYELAGLQQRLTNTSIHQQSEYNVSHNDLQLRELGLESPTNYNVNRLQYNKLNSPQSQQHINIPINISVTSNETNNPLFNSTELALNQPYDTYEQKQQYDYEPESPAIILPNGTIQSPKRTRQQTRRGVTIFRVERSGRFIELQQPENPQEVWERKQAALRANNTIRLDTNIIDNTLFHAQMSQQNWMDESPSNTLHDVSQTPLLTNIQPDNINLSTNIGRQIDTVIDQPAFNASMSRNASLKVPLRIGSMRDAQTSPHEPHTGSHLMSPSLPQYQHSLRSPLSGAIDEHRSQNNSYMADSIDESIYDEQEQQDPFKTVPEDTSVAMHVDGLALDKIRTFISAFAKGISCPYLEFYRCVRNLKLAGNAVKKQVGKDHWWQPVHKTEVCYDTQNPQWSPFVIPAWTLCHNNYDRPILIRVWDYSRSGYDPRPMGEVVTTLRELLNANIDGLKLILNRVDRKNAKQVDKHTAGALIFRTVGLCQQMTPADAIKKLPTLPDTVPITAEQEKKIDLNFTSNPLVDRSYMDAAMNDTFDNLVSDITMQPQSGGFVDYSSVTLVRLICRATGTSRQSLLHANAPWLRVYRPAGRKTDELRSLRRMGTGFESMNTERLENRSEDNQWIEMHTTEVLKSDANDRPWRAFILNLHALHKSMCKNVGHATHRFDSVNSPSVTHNTSTHHNAGCICYDTPLRFVCYSGHYHSGVYIGETKVTLRRMFTSFNSDMTTINEYEDQTLNLNTVNVLGTTANKGKQLDLDLINPTAKSKSLTNKLIGGKYTRSGILSITGVTVYMPSDISHLISTIATSPPEAEDAVFHTDGAAIKPIIAIEPTPVALDTSTSQTEMTKAERRASKRASRKLAKEQAAQLANSNAFVGNPTNVYNSRRGTIREEEKIDVAIEHDIVDNTILMNHAHTAVIQQPQGTTAGYHSDDSLDNLDPENWADIPITHTGRSIQLTAGRNGTADKLQLSDLTRHRTSFKYSAVVSPHSGQDENIQSPADVMDLVDNIRTRNATLTGQPMFGTLNRQHSMARDRTGSTMTGYNTNKAYSSDIGDLSLLNDVVSNKPEINRTRSMNVGYRGTAGRATSSSSVTAFSTDLDSAYTGTATTSRRNTMSTKKDKSRYNTLDKAAMAEWNSLMKKAKNNKTQFGTMKQKVTDAPNTRNSRGETMNDLKQFFNPNAEPDTPAEARLQRNKSGKPDSNTINQIAHQYALKQLQGSN